MKGRWLWIVISVNLLALVALAFAYPNLMVAPGPLIPGHAELATDCFACHAPLRGAVADRCIVCHQVVDIGLRTTRGAPVPPTRTSPATPLKVSFHQELAEQDCMACHSDHAGPGLTRHSRRPFSHGLLRAATRDRCDACHTAPGDTLHRRIAGQCAQCHSTNAWKPATFEHDKLFLLDQDHNVACATCHTANDYRQYTCYGCHEHTPANVRAEHIEEGISNFEDCVKCHRSADGEPQGKDGRASGDERQRDKRD